MAQRVAIGELVGSGGIEEVAGEGAELGALEIPLVVHGHGLVAGRRVQAPADMGDAVGVPVVPGRHVAPEQLGIGARTLDPGDEVVLDGQRHRVLQVALEGQVHVADVEHQRTVHRIRRREGDDDAARPVGDGLGPVAIAPHPGARRSLDGDPEIGAGIGMHGHFLGGPDLLHRRLDLFRQRRIGQQPLEGVRVFVRHHEQPRPVADDPRQFGRVQHAFDGEIDHHGAFGQRLDHRAQPLNHVGRARGTHRHRRRLGRGRHDHMERPGAQAQQGQFGQVDVDLPGLGFGEDGDLLARLDLAVFQRRDEGLDPPVFDAILEHAASPISSAGCHK